MKQAISIRIDPDIIEAFRQQFPHGYQRGMHQVLRDYVERRNKQANILAGRAQQIYNQYHPQCFWHLRKDLKITVEDIPMVQEGLRRNGGREGFLLAAELDLPKIGDI